MKRINMISAVGVMLVVGLVTLVMRSNNATASTPTVICTFAGGQYTCPQVLASGMHVQLNNTAGTGQNCHANITGVGGSPPTYNAGGNYVTETGCTLDGSTYFGYAVVVPCPDSTPRHCDLQIGSNYSCSKQLDQSCDVQLDQNPSDSVDWNCVATVNYSGSGSANLRITENTNACPFGVTSTQIISYSVPHTTTPTVTCTASSAGGPWTCARSLVVNDHVGMVVYGAVCHATVQLVTPPTTAQVNITEPNVSGGGCTLTGTQTITFSPPAPSTVLCPDVPRDGNHPFKDWIYDFAGRGYLVACQTNRLDPVTNQPLPPLPFQPDLAFDRGQASVWALRLLTGNGAYQPPPAQ